MINPIINELLRLKLISKSNLRVLNNKTRDKKIRVIKDTKSKIIFLEKYRTNKNYYSSIKNRKDYIKVSKKKIINHNKNFENFNSRNSPVIENDKRRAIQFKKLTKEKNILDFGCGFGSFLKNIKNSKSLNGIELNEQCLNYIHCNIKKINISNDINFFKSKFDLITMFHVLEHIPYQIKTLKMLCSKLKKKGKIILEVPHAEDFLILQDELREFKNFTFWSEHLILRTHKSLKKVLVNSGFKNINIQYYQRYNFSNHLGWFLKKKPGGHEIYKDIIDNKLNNAHCENLIRLGLTDTLIAIAEKNNSTEVKIKII